MSKPRRIPWPDAVALAERSEITEPEAQDIMAATFAAAGNRIYHRKLLATGAAYQLGLERGRAMAEKRQSA